MRQFFARLLPPLPLIFPAIFSGVALALCFPTVSLGWLCFVALVPVLVAFLRARPGRKESYRTGYLFGLTFFLAMLWWIAKLIPYADVTIPWLMTPAIVVLVLYLALYPAVLFLLTCALSRYRFMSVLAVVPAGWTLLEMLRGRGELGFPWGAAGYALSDYPSMIQGAASAGLPGLTFVIVLVNVLLSGVFVVRARAGRIGCAAAAVAVVTGMWWHGSTELANAEEPGLTSARVAVVQPNVDLAVKWKPEFKDSTFNLIERLVRESAEQGAELVIFPETSAPVYIDGRQPQYKARLHQLAIELQVPILIGFLDHRVVGEKKEMRTYNSAGLFDVDGQLHRYQKSHLLPFGESLPWSWRWRFLRKINFGQSNFEPGPAQPPIQSRSGLWLTPLICFESVFPGLSRRGVMDGAQLLVNITNDGWFDDTPGPYQHTQMSILRAVENRRYLLRSANTGVSMIVDPMGRVLEQIGWDRQGILVRDVSLGTGQTVYDRYADGPILLLCALLLGFGVFIAQKRVG